MASNDDQTLHNLMGLPLEVRHNIFDHVAVRESEPKKLLRYWFEKKEVKAMVAAQDPNASSPHIVYAGDDFESEESEEVNESDSDDGSDYGSDQAEEDDSEGYNDSDVIDAEGESDDEDLDAEEADMQDALMAQVAQTNTSLASSSAQGTAPAQSQPQIPAAPTQLTGAPTVAQTSSTSASAPTVAVPATHGQEEIGHQDADAYMDEDNEEFHDGQNGTEEDTQMNVDNDNEDGHEEAHVESDEEMVEDGDDEEAAAAPPAPVVKAHRKWRHIPKFMRITRCPPPVELLLASKELNAQAKSWFYDVAVLRINATGSFAHTSFFEEAFSQIADAAFSPMEDIRKVEIMFVWDTTWIRSEQASCAAAIFPALLRQRAIFVANILAQAPCLREVTVHWHDSAEDEEAQDIMNDVLADFLCLGVDFKVKTHYIAADAKPYRKSIAGKQRVEFQRIIDDGIDRLF